MPAIQSSGYVKPPIVEAVIAVHFQTPLDQKDIEAFARKNKKSFPFAEEMVSIQTAVNLHTKQQMSTTAQKIGYKLSSADRTRLTAIMHDG
jgi:uncharacterized protein (TIGR04255 family)